MKKCCNCKRSTVEVWDGEYESCFDYMISGYEESTAETCEVYDEGTPECFSEERYCPSATAGDYSPSCPWNAPGMSIRDFI